jgi:hypothetical protein
MIGMDLSWDNVFMSGYTVYNHEHQQWEAYDVSEPELSTRKVFQITEDTPNGYYPSVRALKDYTVSKEDVLQVLNKKTDNEPQKVYSANAMNQYIIAPVLQMLDEKEDIGNKITEIKDNHNDTQYPTAKAVYEFGTFIFQAIEAQVDTQINELEERLTAYIGGIENGSY